MGQLELAAFQPWGLAGLTCSAQRGGCPGKGWLDRRRKKHLSFAGRPREQPV